MMLKNRIIPSLTLKDGCLVKTSKFKCEKYLGDPINAVNIFSKKKADELILLDISKGQSSPNFELIREIAEEAQMPLSYGGKIKKFEHAKRLFKLGVEKLIVNEAAFTNPDLLKEIIKYAGASSLVVALNIGETVTGSGEFHQYSSHGHKILAGQLSDNIEKINSYNVGEVLVCDRLNEGTGKGLNQNLISFFSDKFTVPFLISGGCNGLKDAKNAIKNGADGVVASSFFVLYGEHNAALITYPVPGDF